MNTSMIIELAGYLGSVLVVVSMLMSSVVKLRIINTAGSIISATYALIIQSYPLALMNICLIIINIYNLARLLRSNEPYDLVDVKTDDIFLTYFLDYYQQDIQNFFSGSKIFTFLCGYRLYDLLQRGSGWTAAWKETKRRDNGHSHRLYHPNVPGLLGRQLFIFQIAEQGNQQPRLFRQF